MFFNNSDRDWGKFGKFNPYYGVISQEKFDHKNLTDESIKEFFNSGKKHVEFILDSIKISTGTLLKFNSALDFGCGVGRITFPLSEYFDTTVGVDVSDAMLNEAKANSLKYRIKNINFFKTKDFFLSNDKKYDLIHSFIVFQHIPSSKGMKLFILLLDLLEVNGVAVIHFVYASNCSKVDRLKSFIRKNIPMGNILSNIINGRKIFDPLMQMNKYNLNKIYRIIQNRGFRIGYHSFTDHGGELGIILFIVNDKLGAISEGND